VVWQLIFMVIGSAVSPPERQAALMPTGISSQKETALYASVARIE
jgi:hypothetical protein